MHPSHTRTNKETPVSLEWPSGCWGHRVLSHQGLAELEPDTREIGQLGARVLHG